MHAQDVEAGMQTIAFVEEIMPLTFLHTEDLQILSIHLSTSAVKLTSN
jgi:hypothetical protein